MLSFLSLQLVNRPIFHGIFILLLLLSNLSLSAQTGSVSGHVLLQKVPTQGIRISIDSLKTGVLTDEKGYFLLTGIPFGEHRLSVRYLGTLLEERSLTVVQASTLSLDTLRYTEGLQLDGVDVVSTLEEGGEEQALIMMMESSRLMSILGAEGIARLPDKNAAEALRRMAGVVMETDQGEGRFISFRGTPKDWNAALVNGDRMPVANEEMEGRSLSFDVLPTSLVEYILYYQNLTPEIEGDAIGGSANFITRVIPAEPKLEIEGGVGYNAKAQQPMWNGSLLAGRRFADGKFGLLAGGSAYTRNWATDNFEVFYGSNETHSIDRMELRHYDGQRTTYGGHFRFDYQPDSNHTLYTLGFIGQMQDDEFNRKTLYKWVAGVGQSIALQNIHNVLEQRLLGGEVGGNHRWDKLSVHWKVASYETRFQFGPVPFDRGDARNGYYVVEFELPVFYQDYLYLDFFGEPTDEANAFTRLRLLDIDSPIEGYGDPYDNIQPDFIKRPFVVKPEDTLFSFTKAFSERNRHTERDPIVAALALELPLLG